MSIVLLLATVTGFSSLALDGRHGDLTKTNYFDAKLNLSADMEALTDSDGGVYAVKIRVHNLSKTNDLMLRLFDVPELALFLSMSVTPSDNPMPLTKKLPVLKSNEYHWVYMPLEKASTIEWFVRVSDRISEPRALPERTLAYLSANLIFDCSQSVEGKLQELHFDRASINFYLPSVVCTRKALEGDPTEKYEKSLKAAGGR